MKRDTHTLRRSGALRVLMAGFKHETNTFGTDLTPWSAFERGEMLPAAVSGPAMLEMVSKVDISATGFVNHAKRAGWEIMPSLWCGAVPSSYVTDAAFEHICQAILGDVRKGGFDAIYLELHGAALTESFDDAEGELLTRIRAVVGDAIPIVASLDLHANVTPAMLAQANAMVAFRTYPHIDYVKTGERAAVLLERILANGGRREKCHSARLPFLISIGVQSTMTEPARGCYRYLETLDTLYGAELSFCMGFPASDFAGCAPMVWGYGEQAAEAVERLYARVSEPSQWRLQIPAAAEAVALALARADESPRTIVIADTQDNPGTGGTATTTGMLHALLAAKAGEAFVGRVAFGVIFDAEAARLACEAGPGRTVRCSLGESVQTPSGFSEAPVVGDFKVMAVSDGKTTFKGPKMTGFKTQLGPTACLEIEGVRVVVASARIGAQDRELFRMVGVHPEQMKLIVVKSSHHFRADFEALVEDPERDILTARAPGNMPVDPGDLPWKKLSPLTRTRP